MKNDYKVYVHIFPNGKRYVGCTGTSLKTRWNGGLGYREQPNVFEAILKFGWNNIKHYVVFDNLTKNEAMFYEAMLIYGWKTYRKSIGYNTIIPKVKSIDDVNCPTFRECNKHQIDDIYEESIDDRLNEIVERPSYKTKKVRCITTGEIFDDVLYAAIMHGNGHAQSIRKAITGNYPSGTCWVNDDECGLIEVPARWEYVE